PRYQVLQKSFSEGDFTSFRCKSEKQVGQTASTSATVAEPSGGISEDSDLSTGVYSCPQDGCVRVFQRVSALEKHLSVEKCSRSPVKYSLMDLAKMGYKTHLEEDVGILPSLKAPVAHQEGHFVPNEGWALRAAKKAYRFSEKQKSYLLAKFSMGQTTGRKLDAEVVAREMRRARGADGVRLFQSSEFLTSLQIASFFSRQSPTLRQKDPADEADIRASQEEANFSTAKEVVETIQLNHPLEYDQYNLCEMALSGNLKVLKLPMLQRLCEDLGRDAPVPPVRKKAPYLALLEEIAKKCTCRK
ncbi:unnamed protein product, partial [Porites lobata]